MTHGFTKRVSVDVSYLYKGFTVNPALWSIRVARFFSGRNIRGRYSPAAATSGRDRHRGHDHLHGSLEERGRQTGLAAAPIRQRELAPCQHLHQGSGCHTHQERSGTYIHLPTYLHTYIPTYPPHTFLPSLRSN